MSSELETDLYSSLRDELDKHLQRIRMQAQRDVLSLPPIMAGALGQIIARSLRQSGFYTLVVTGRERWDPEDQYYKSIRAAAARGCHIEAAFLLPHRHCRQDKSLQLHAGLDNASGVRTTAFYIGELLSTSSLPRAASLDLGLWDNQVTCTQLRDGDRGAGITEWSVSRRAEDLDLVRRIRAKLVDTAPRVDLGGHASENGLDLDEPMMTTAPLARELASVLCKGDHVSAEDCSWYHSVWQYLRVLNMVSTPTWHAHFYVEQFRQAAETGEHNRVLISGAADYSMLAHVLWGYRRAGVVPQVTVLDLCETPLFLCKWYGKSVGIPVTTVAVDLLAHKTSAPYDLVTTDAFLTRFPPQERARILASWRSLLRGAGKVVTTVRVEPGMRSVSVKADRDQSSSFCMRALEGAERWYGFLGISPEQLAKSARKYADHMVSYSFGSQKEVSDLFETVGFQVDSIEIDDVPGEMAPAKYARIVATNPTRV